jgi:hypothetical protein
MKELSELIKYEVRGRFRKKPGECTNQKAKEGRRRSVKSKNIEDGIAEELRKNRANVGMKESRIQ